MCSREALNFVKFTIALKNIKIHGPYQCTCVCPINNLYVHVPEKMQKVTIGTIKVVTRNTWQVLWVTCMTFTVPMVTFCCHTSVYMHTFDGPLMLWVNWTIVDTIHLKITSLLRVLRSRLMVTQNLLTVLQSASLGKLIIEESVVWVLCHCDHNPVCIYMIVCTFSGKQDFVSHAQILVMQP